MRLTWLSNAPWVPTGYGNQTRTFTNRLNAAGYPTAVIAFFGHEGIPINFGTTLVYGRGFQLYGGDVAEAHSVDFHADLMLSLMDTFVMDPDLWPRTRWVPWFPIDHEPIPLRVLEPVRKAYHALTMSKFGSAQMDAAGVEYTYIPHGIETDVFKPTEPTDEIRKYFGLPKDRFIVGMVAANKGYPPRKAFFQNIVAFAALHQKHPDALLYLHTFDGNPPRPEQVPLVEFCQRVGLTVGKDVMFPSQHGLTLGFPDQIMAQIYSAMDVHLLVSMGEGFGIPIVEAQACGTPVIVGDWTSMGELCFSGWKVDKKDATPWYTELSSFQFLPRPEAIAECLDAAYERRGNQEYRKAARKGALAYDADKVMEKYWLPFLRKMEERIANEPKPAPATVG